MRACRLHIVVRESRATILAWGERPGGRLGSSSCRHSVGYTNSLNHRNFCRENDSNNDANVFSNNVPNIFANNAPNNAACSCSRSSRYSWLRPCRNNALSSCRRTCRRGRVRSRIHICRYFAAHFVTYIPRPNRACSASLKFAQEVRRVRRLTGVPNHTVEARRGHDPMLAHGTASTLSRAAGIT